MIGRKQRFAVILLVLAFMFAAAFYQLPNGTVDWIPRRLLSFGDDDRRFNASLLRYLTALSGEPTDQSQRLANWTPTFVTATSGNHFLELRGMVHSMLSTHPDTRFVIYDLGLAREQRDDVRRWCNARYVSFDFNRYPRHVKDLLTYAWKPLIIAEQLNELGTFFWFDASPRLNCSDLSIFPRAVLNGSVEPLLTFGSAGHSIFAATHPGMLEYFPPVDVELLKVTEMKYATAIFVSDSSYTRAVLKRVILCALTKDCIAPDRSRLSCKFRDRYKDYGNCHRYDQSAFALARLHMLYLRGYCKFLDGSHLIEPEGMESPISAEQLRTLSTVWERRYEAFESCIVLARGGYYKGTIPSCNRSSTIRKI